MELVCAVCLERKSTTQCSLAKNMKEGKYKEYIIENKLTLNIDGNYYICKSCKIQMNKNFEPRRCQKGVSDFLTFPESMSVLLESICYPKNIDEKNDPEKKYLKLNRCEDYLLKLIIPFIRVAHLPRGRYFKVIGDLILITADLVHSLDKIIPLKQSLIPVSFKRKLEYKGHYIEEYIDKDKVLAYFCWLKKNNHLFNSINMDISPITNFMNESIENSMKMDEANTSHIGTESMSGELKSNHSTHLRNKYTEDIDTETVTNKLANLIVHFEKKETEAKQKYTDEEDISYSDDEDVSLSDYEEEEDEQPNLIRKVSNLKSNIEGLLCSNSEGNISIAFNKLLEMNENDDIGTNRFTSEIVRKIEEKAQKIFVAPGQEGKFMNWMEDIFIEEMAFPSLFPYGIGGYLTSNILRGSDIGFANYCKNRILSADSKFRNDHIYMFFLLLVKELIEIKRSKSTYFRKAAKQQNLTKATIKLISKEDLTRNNNFFNVFKNLRGSVPYYQKSKKDLFATIRQYGAPTLFQTFSCAEFDWDYLCQQIYKTVYKKNIEMEDIRNKDAKWKNTLVSGNVVQSTVHFQKRTQKLIALMCTRGFYEINEEDVETSDFAAKHYFYRVEFQQRGAPHIHCLLWLEGQKSIENAATQFPPTLWIETDDDNPRSKKTIANDIASFASSIIYGSSSDAHCLIHSKCEKNCLNCAHTRQSVEKYQKHKHTFTCKKKNRIITILPREGHGSRDGQLEGAELKLPVCRFGVPFFPMNKTTYIFGFDKDTSKQTLNKAKVDYQKVKKYILRMTSDASFENSSYWDKFKSMSFEFFLLEAGMCEGLDLDINYVDNATKRYLIALRSGVKGSGTLFLKRSPCDVFTNNYNNKLMNYHEANQDIQYVSDMWACATYVTNYLTKTETNMSSLLQSINEESVKNGLQTTKIIDRLSRALDKHREVSIQETVYRILGFPMCRFSSVVQFINTVHPHKRDGLLKSNLDEDDDSEIFHNSLFTYYESRPKSANDEFKSQDYWDNLCVAEFAANFDIVYGNPSSKKSIPLQNNKGFIKERNSLKTLRYYLNHENDEDFCRALCILFLPFRNEMHDIHTKDVVALVAENRKIIDEKRTIFEKHMTLIEILENVEKRISSERLECIDDELCDEYTEEETTDKKDREDFEKSSKKDDMQLLSYFKDSIDMSVDLLAFRNLISGLNNQQRYIFDDFVERICDTSEKKAPFYLYIGGEAGTGKSHLLKALIEGTKYLGKYSGKELKKPSVIVMAPTGNAAYIIHGKTIESTLGMIPQKGQGYRKMSANRESTLHYIYDNVLAGFIDEVSMVGTNKFSKINFHLQDVMGNKMFMGGIPLVVTGDFGQLPPVSDKIIWASSNIDGRPMMSINHWDENFKIFFLTEKMRTADMEFSEICDKVRKGFIDSDVETFLKSRVIQVETLSETSNDSFKYGKLSIIVPSNKKREEINREKLEQLLSKEKSYYATAMDRVTNFKQRSNFKQKVSENCASQLSLNLVLKKNAPVILTCNHPLLRYRDDGLNNGARGYVDSIQSKPDNPDMAEIVWVVFNDRSIGKTLRHESSIS